MRLPRLLIPVCVLTCTAAALAQSEQELRDWFQRELDGAGVALPTGVGMRFEVQSLKEVDADELNRLRAVVDADQNHPLRSRLDELERGAHGENKAILTLWDEGTRWRLCRDTPTAPLPFIDEAGTDTQGWQLTARQLTILDSRRKAPGGRDVAIARSGAVGVLDWLFTGCLSTYKTWHVEIEQASLEQNGWSLVLASDHGPLHIRGTWDTKIHRGFIRSAEGEADSGVARHEWGPWLLDPALNRWVS